MHEQLAGSAGSGLNFIGNIEGTQLPERAADVVVMDGFTGNIALKLIELLCARLRRTSEQVEDIMYLSFPGRLAKTLLQLTGGPAASAAQRKVRITQREISNIIGMSRESTNKQLRAWAKRGWIRLERGGVGVIAPDKLTAIAAEGADFDPS